jgi:hypothetical protein
MFTGNPWTGTVLEFTSAVTTTWVNIMLGDSHLLKTCEKRYLSQLSSWPTNFWHSSWWLNHNNFVICLFQTEWGSFASKKFAVIQFYSRLFFFAQVSSVLLQLFSVHDLYILILLQLCWDHRVSRNHPLVCFAVPITGMLCVTNTSGMKRTMEDVKYTRPFHSTTYSCMVLFTLTLGGWIGVTNKIRLAHYF